VTDMLRRTCAVFCGLICLCSFSCKSGKTTSTEKVQLVKTGSMELRYAEQFSVDYYEGGYSLARIGDDSFLIVPEGAEVPGTDGDVTVIRQPVENIYVAASSAMDLFDGIGSLDEVAMTSTAEKDWSLPDIRDAVGSGSIAYIGKYSSPDYEALVSGNCGLAVESTMIYHTPEVREKIEALGIPVLVERSSYESHPLGRMEWLKLYGLLTGDAESAEDFFNEKTKGFDELMKKERNDGERKTAAFFYISSNGYVNIRKPGDYISKMIELAGGSYIFTADQLKIEDNALSTMNIQTETFYETARDADFLIYNSTIEGELDSVEQLIGKCGVLADCKAVKNGNVWCTGQNMFQQTTGAADMICDLELVFSQQADGKEMSFLHRLE